MAMQRAGPFHLDRESWPRTATDMRMRQTDPVRAAAERRRSPRPRQTSGGPTADDQMDTWASAAVKACRRVTWGYSVGLSLLAVIGITIVDSMDVYQAQFIPNAPAVNLRHIGGSIPFIAVNALGVVPIALVFLVEVCRRGVDPFCPPLKWERLATSIQVSLAVVDASLFASFWAEVCKSTFGQLRPDFQAECLGSSFPDTVPTTSTACTLDAKESRKSFPSGHVAVCSAYSTVLTAYIVWRLLLRIRSTESKCRSEWFSFLSCFTALPMAFPLYIAITRVHDHRHTVLDVFAGLFIGFLCGLTSFLRALFCSTYVCPGVRPQEPSLYSTSSPLNQVVTPTGSPKSTSGAAKGVMSTIPVQTLGANGLHQFAPRGALRSPASPPKSQRTLARDIDG